MRSFVPTLGLLVTATSLGTSMPDLVLPDETVKVLVAQKEVPAWSRIKRPQEFFTRVEYTRGASRMTPLAGMKTWNGSR